MLTLGGRHYFSLRKEELGNDVKFSNTKSIFEKA